MLEPEQAIDTRQGRRLAQRQRHRFRITTSATVSTLDWRRLLRLMNTPRDKLSRDDAAYFTPVGYMSPGALQQLGARRRRARQTHPGKRGKA